MSKKKLLYGGESLSGSDIRLFNVIIGSDYSIYVASDGSIYCQGSNEGGVFGLPTSVISNTDEFKTEEKFNCVNLTVPIRESITAVIQENDLIKYGQTDTQNNFIIQTIVSTHRRTYFMIQGYSENQELYTNSGEENMIKYHSTVLGIFNSNETIITYDHDKIYLLDEKGNIGNEMLHGLDKTIISNVKKIEIFRDIHNELNVFVLTRNGELYENNHYIQSEEKKQKEVKEEKETVKFYQITDPEVVFDITCANHVILTDTTSLYLYGYDQRPAELFIRDVIEKGKLSDKRKIQYGQDVLLIKGSLGIRGLRLSETQLLVTILGVGGGVYYMDGILNKINIPQKDKGTLPYIGGAEDSQLFTVYVEYEASFTVKFGTDNVPLVTEISLVPLMNPFFGPISDTSFKLKYIRTMVQYYPEFYTLNYFSPDDPNIYKQFIDQGYYTKTRILKTIPTIAYMSKEFAIKLACENPNFFNEDSFMILMGTSGLYLKIGMVDAMNTISDDSKMDVYHYKLRDFFIDHAYGVQNGTVRIKPGIIAVTASVNREIFADNTINRIELSSGLLIMTREQFEASGQQRTRMIPTIIIIRNQSILKQFIIHLNQKGYQPDFRIRFEGEEGIDSGGLKREFFTLIGKELLEKKFFVCIGDVTDGVCSTTYTINIKADFSIFTEGLDPNIIANAKIPPDVTAEMYIGLLRLGKIFGISVNENCKLSIPLANLILGSIAYGASSTVNPLSYFKEITQDEIIKESKAIFQPKTNLEVNLFYLSNLDDCMVDKQKECKMEEKLESKCRIQEYFTPRGTNELLVGFNSITNEAERKVIIGKTTEATVSDFAAVLDYTLNGTYKDSYKLVLTDAEGAITKVTTFSPIELFAEEFSVATNFSYRKELDDLNKIQVLFYELPTIDTWLSNTYVTITNSSISHIKYTSLDEIKKAPIDSTDEGDKTAQKGLDVVIWFWEIMKELDQAQVLDVYQFITGAGSFLNVPHIIRIISEMKEGSLPEVHSCFYEINMPIYASKEITRERLLLSVKLSKGTGFGLSGGSSYALYKAIKKEYLRLKKLALEV